MTSAEIQERLNQAKEKVEKRKVTISKLCSKVGINANDLLDEYVRLLGGNYNNDYLSLKPCRELVHSFKEELPQRDEHGNWLDDNYEFNSKLEQLAENLSKLYDVEKVVKGWELRLQKQSNKENVEQIPILVEFLNRWEQNCKDYYHRESQEYLDSYNEFHNIQKKFLNDNNYSSLDYNQKRELVPVWNDFIRSNYGKQSRYRYGTHAYSVDEWVNDFDSLTQQLTSVRFIPANENSWYDNNFGYGAQDGHYELRNFDDERLNKLLHEEKIRKYAKLVEQVTAITGPITDVSGLSIDVRGDLNGIVVGENGKAKVNTIGAGGYNQGVILDSGRHGQCFHYRCLVKPIR